MVEDYAEAFLVAFETTTVMAAWPHTQWVPILGPYLTSPTQVVLWMMLAMEALNYDCAVSHQANFRSLRYKLGD